MSVFFGVFNSDGKIDGRVFNQMYEATHCQGSDELETHFDEYIAMGHLMLRVTNESFYDKQPLKSSCGRYLLTGHFRLDYRDELGDKLGLSQKDLAVTPDSLLVILAFQKWSHKCVHQLEGDWAFCVFDNLRKELFMAKDSTGISALFYMKYRNSFYFSSDPSLFSRCKFYEPEIDDVQLVFSSVQNLKIEKGKTLFKSLYSLKNGSYLKVDSHLNTNTYEYFDLFELTVSKTFKFQEDLFFEYKSVYANAVKVRLMRVKQTGLFLSSGFDSMSVFELAADELTLLNKYIYTYTNIPSKFSVLSENESEIADESKLVEFVVKKRANAKAHFCGFDDFSISDSKFDCLRLNPYMPFITTNSFWINGILKQGKQEGIRNFLTGQMGNFTLSNDAYFVHVEMMFSLRFKDLFFELSRHAKVNNQKIFYSIKSRILKVLKYQLKIYQNYKNLFNEQFLKHHGVFDYFRYRYYVSDFQKRKGEWLPNYFKPFKQRTIRQSQLNKYLYYGNIDWYIYSINNAVEVSDPTSDKRLIELSLSIDDLWFNKFGEAKYLYKNIFRGIVDSRVINNKKSMIQSYDYLNRIQRDKMFLPFVEEILSKVDDQNLAEKDYIYNEAILLSKVKINYSKRQALSKFLHKISLLNFLANYKSRNFIL